MIKGETECFDLKLLAIPSVIVAMDLDAMLVRSGSLRGTNPFGLRSPTFVHQIKKHASFDVFECAFGGA